MCIFNPLLLYDFINNMIGTYNLIKVIALKFVKTCLIRPLKVNGYCKLLIIIYSYVYIIQ